jgi:hypothetical protein
MNPFGIALLVLYPFLVVGLRVVLAQSTPGIPSDVLAAGTPGVLLFVCWCFIQEWICTGRALRRERLRGDRLELALLKSVGVNEVLAVTLKAGADD